MEDIRRRVQTFVLDSLLLGDESRMPADDESLLQSGAIDSTGVLELIEFLEAEFCLRVIDTETTPENLDGIDRIVAYVDRKQTPEGT